MLLQWMWPFLHGSNTCRYAKIDLKCGPLFQKNLLNPGGVASQKPMPLYPPKDIPGASVLSCRPSPFRKVWLRPKPTPTYVLAQEITLSSSVCCIEMEWNYLQTSNAVALLHQVSYSRIYFKERSFSVTLSVWLDVISLATFQYQNQAHALPSTEDTGLVLKNVYMI